ncbi:MAG: FG-GAP-like repeat-containing protein [Planctomycetota bacterium]
MRPQLATLALASSFAAAQISVTNVHPLRQRTTVSPATSISITFAEALQPTSVHGGSFAVYGRWSGVARGTLQLSNGNQTVTFAPSRPFFPGETVTVMLSDAVTAVSNRRLNGGYTWSFWTQPARGTRTLSLAATIPVRRSGEARIRTYGAYAGDLDRDGAPDLSLPNEDANDVRVLRNDGCGNYSLPVLHPLQPGNVPSTNEGQDFNGDGFIDLAVGNIAAGALSILLGDGNGGYLPAVQYPSGSGTRGLCVLDVDGDGDVDVVTANRVSSNLALHRNRGDGTFAPATFFDGGGDNETAVAAADADGDGIADLFVGCNGSSTITVLRGDGAGGFTLSGSTPVQGQPWMIVVGDVDGDGVPDAVTCNSSQPRVAVARGNGSGGLLAAAHYTVGAFPLAIDLGDIDGDGALDFVASNFSGSGFTAYWNAGNGTFTAPVTLPSPQAGSCAILVDDDRDGDLDVVGVDELADVLLLYRQTTPVPPGVQPADCRATLRLDQLAGYAGFGSAPRESTTGATLFVGVTGGAAQAFAVFLGLSAQPGAVLPFGTFNLQPAPLLPLPAAVTDPFGEATIALPIPLGAAVPFTLTAQGVVLDPTHPSGARLTNAESVSVPR